MNSQQQKDRNARKRAKLRAKKHGETSFTHVYIDAEVMGCQFPRPIKYLGGSDWEAEVILTMCEDCKRQECRWSYHHCFASESRLIIGRLAESTVSLEAAYESVKTRVESLGKGVRYTLTVAVTNQGQRSVKEWHETTGQAGIGAADVIAALLQ